MKVILSRKGFDTQYGGYPSPILPDGRMISLPIPSNDEITYNDLQVDKQLSYFHLMKQLNQRIKFNNESHILTKHMGCHLDPDINSTVIKRHNYWKPLFGQINASQTHLENQGVKEGDLFLFFGTFRKTTLQDNIYCFDSSQELHIIFGYLQIGEIVSVDNNSEIPEWMNYHPHTAKKRLGGNNTIYIAKQKLSWQSDAPGAGMLNFNNKQVLTKMGYTKSKWNLPPYFKDVVISYHSENSWKEDYFQSASKGQEFVVEDNKQIENWAKDIVSG